MPAQLFDFLWLALKASFENYFVQIYIYENEMKNLQVWGVVVKIPFLLKMLFVFVFHILYLSQVFMNEYNFRYFF